MTPKEYLQQIKDTEEYIAEKEEELYRLECLATSITAPADREAVQTSNISDKVGKIAIKIALMRSEILERKAKYIDILQECTSVIEEVREHNKLFYKILYNRYIKDKSLKKIAAESNYSYDYIREAHGYALLKVGKILKNRNYPHKPTF